MEKILEKAGWKYLHGLWVLKSPTVRLSWDPRHYTFYLGYGMMPVKFTQPSQFIAALDLCDLYEEADKIRDIIDTADYDDTV